MGICEGQKVKHCELHKIAFLTQFGLKSTYDKSARPRRICWWGDSKGHGATKESETKQSHFGLVSVESRTRKSKCFLNLEILFCLGVPLGPNEIENSTDHFCPSWTADGLSEFLVSDRESHFFFNFTEFCQHSFC